MKKTVALFVLSVLTVVSFFGQPSDPISVDASGVVRINTPNLIVNGVEYSFIPEGAIIMWSGTKVPDGWALCDGKPSEGFVPPDLSGRFIVGYNPSDTEGGKVGESGGLAKVALTVEEMPKHTHTMPKSGSHEHNYLVSNRSYQARSAGDPLEYGMVPATTTGEGLHSHPIDPTGGSVAHENRPPYYTLAYIIKIKTKGSGDTILIK